MTAVFILAFAAQYWSYVLYAIWNFIEIPPLEVIYIAAFFTNFGGFFNAVAYTFIRRKYLKVGHEESTITAQQNSTASTNMVMNSRR